jgi:nucleoside-diphosphate-sugar epimerase
MKTVFITGASGFFGRSVLRALKAGLTQDRYVCVSHRNLVTVDDARFTSVQVDLMQEAAMRAIVQKYKPTHVIHLAWFVEHGAFWHAPQNVDWVWATVKLCDAFLKNGGRQFIGAGTLFEHDLCTNPLNEDAPIAPKTLYAESKVATHRLLQQCMAHHGSEAIMQWLRIGYFFGAEESPQKFLSHAVRTMMRGEPVKTLSRNAVRDYGHVDGLGRIVAGLLECDASGAFLVSGGTDRSMGSLLEHMAKKLNYTRPILYDAYIPPAFEPLKIQPSLQKVLTSLRCQVPGLSLEQDLDTFVLDKFNAFLDKNDSTCHVAKNRAGSGQ